MGADKRRQAGGVGVSPTLSLSVGWGAPRHGDRESVTVKMLQLGDFTVLILGFA